MGVSSKTHLSMYTAYQIKSLPKNVMDYFAIGEKRQKQNSEVTRAELDTFLKPGGSMDAAKMMEEWFADTQHPVFISHSRLDKEEALALSGWLEKEFGLTSFIDSCCWGHADELLRLLDFTYCRDDPKTNIVSYKGSLITASHVHLMLSTALTKMMDRCECVFFLNSENSIKEVSIKDMVKSDKDAITQSPWLFHEISMLKLLRRREKADHRESLTNFSAEGVVKKADVDVPKFDYPVDLDGVPALGASELAKWLAKRGGDEYLVEHGVKSLRRFPLDLLYEVSPPQ